MKRAWLRKVQQEWSFFGKGLPGEKLYRSYRLEFVRCEITLKRCGSKTNTMTAGLNLDWSTTRERDEFLFMFNRSSNYNLFRFTWHVIIS